MKLKNLNNYTNNNFDKIIADMINKDSEEKLNQYVTNVIGELINLIAIETHIKDSINKNLDEKNMAKTYSYTALIPYVQLKLQDNKDVAIIANEYIETLLSYLVGYIDENSFDNMFAKMKITLEISDDFFNAIIEYFNSYSNQISNSIKTNIK